MSALQIPIRHLTAPFRAAFSGVRGRVAFLLRMPHEADGVEIPRVVMRLLTLHAVVSVVVLTAVAMTGTLDLHWTMAFLSAALVFDYFRMWSQSSSGGLACGDVPFVIAACVLLSAPQAAVTLLGTVAILALTYSQSRLGIVRIFANSITHTVTLLAVIGVRELLPFGGVWQTTTLLGVALLGNFAGSAALWLGVWLEDGFSEWAGLVRTAVISTEELFGGLGNIASVLPAIVAAAQYPWLLTTIVVPYVVSWRSARNTEQLAQVEKKVGIDPLTGLFNRERLNEHIASEIDAGERYGHRISLVMGDLDNFKRVNDTMGHIAGDEVLRTTAAIIRDVIDNDARLLAARYGGEEFVIVATTVSHRELLELTESLRSRIHADLNAQFQTSISLGFAVWESGETAEQWIDRADKALYSAKMAGKNRVHEWTVGGSGGEPVRGLHAA